MYMEPMMNAAEKKPVGRPKRQIDTPLSRIIDDHFGGDREAAAIAWQVTPDHLRNVLQGHRQVSAGLKIRIHLSTQISIADLSSL